MSDKWKHLTECWSCYRKILPDGKQVKHPSETIRVFTHNSFRPLDSEEILDQYRCRQCGRSWIEKRDV